MHTRSSFFSDFNMWFQTFKRLFSHPCSEQGPIDKNKYFVRDTDVTDVVAKQGWSLNKPLEARMKKSVVPNLPKPVMMFKHLGKDGEIDKTEVTPNPDEDPSQYGDLLKGFTMKKDKSNKKTWEERKDGNDRDGKWRERKPDDGKEGPVRKEESVSTIKRNYL